MARRKTVSSSDNSSSMNNNETKKKQTKKTNNNPNASFEENKQTNPNGGSSWACFYTPKSNSSSSESSQFSINTLFTRSLRNRATTSLPSTAQNDKATSENSSASTHNNRLLEVMYFLPEGDYIKQITGGSGFTVFLTEMGGIYVHGKNSLGALGLGDYKDRNEITKNSLVEMEMRSNKDKCVQVVCGEASTIFVSEKGFAYVCGCGDNGQLAVGSKHKLGKPTRIKHFDSLTDGENCIEAASGTKDCSVFLTKNKKVYISGSNDHGICEDGITIVSRPVKSEFFEQDNDIVRCFDTSTTFSVFGTENDYLYVFAKSGLAPFHDSRDHTIPSAYNYSFFYQGIKKIICVKGCCFVQNGSNKWFIFHSTREMKATSLDEYLGDTVCPEFKSSKDTIVSVGSDKEGVSVALSKQKRVFTISTSEIFSEAYYYSYIRTYNNSISTRKEPKELTEELKALSGNSEDHNISVAVSNGRYIFYLTSPHSTDNETDQERKLRNLTSDQRWFINNLNTLVDNLTSETVLGKRSGGVGSHSIVVSIDDDSKFMFSDIQVSSFNIQPIHHNSQSCMPNDDDSETFEKQGKKMKK
nr:unnamed protein product [Naegleria fowleri]